MRKKLLSDLGGAGMMPKLGPAGTFWLYAGICVLGFIFILRRLPETKGKSLEQIERELSRAAP